MHTFELSADDGQKSTNQSTTTNNTYYSFSKSQLALYAVGFLSVTALLYIRISTNSDLNAFIVNTNGYFKSLNNIVSNQSTNISAQNQYNIKELVDALDNQNTFFNTLSNRFMGILNRLSTMIRNQDKSHSSGGDNNSSSKTIVEPTWSNPD